MATAPTLFTAHAAANGPQRLVPHRFAWAGFFFGPLWLLAQRLWFAAAAVFVLAALLIGAVKAGALSGGAGQAIWLLLALLIGLEGQEWRRRALIRRTAAIAGFAYGHDEADALAREAFRVAPAASGRTAS